MALAIGATLAACASRAGDGRSGPSAIATPVAAVAPAASASAQPAVTPREEPIGPANITSLHEVARIGRLFSSLATSRSGLLAAGSQLGVFVLDAATFEQRGFVDADGAVDMVALSPDGTLIAHGELGQDDRATVRVRRVADSVVVATLDHPAKAINLRSIEFSPDGRWIAVCTDGEAIQVHAAVDGAVVASIPVPWMGAQACAFSPDGARFAVATGESIRVVAVPGGRALKTLLGPHACGARGGCKDREVEELAFAPGGALLSLVSAPGDRVTPLFVGRNANLPAPLGESGSYMIKARFSPDGRRVAVDEGGRQVVVYTLDRSAGPVRVDAARGSDHYAWSPDSRSLLRLHGDALESWRLDSTPTLERTVATGGPGVAQAYSPYGQALAAGWSGGSAALAWVEGPYVASRSADWLLERHAGVWVGQGAIVRDEGRLVLARPSDASVIRILDPGDVALRSLLAAPSPDGDAVAAARANGDVAIRRIADGALVRVLHGDEGAPSSPAGEVLWSGDGRVVAATRGDGAVRAWRADDGSSLPGLPPVAAGPGRCALAAPRGGALVLCRDRDIVAWTPGSDVPPRVLASGARTNGARFAPDGDHVAAWSDTGSVRLWTLTKPDGGAAVPVAGYVNDPWMAFSADGSQVVTIDPGHQLVLRRSDDGAELRVLVPPARAVSAAFSPDGQMVAAGLEGGRIAFWRAADGAPLAEVHVGGWPQTLAFSPGGGALLVGWRGGPIDWPGGVRVLVPSGS